MFTFENDEVINKLDCKDLESYCNLNKENRIYCQIPRIKT